jgi:hypothetical protein
MNENLEMSENEALAEPEAKVLWDAWMHDRDVLEESERAARGGKSSGMLDGTSKEVKALNAKFYADLQALRRKYGIPEPERK